MLENPLNKQKQNYEVESKNAKDKLTVFFYWKCMIAKIMLIYSFSILCD